MGALYEEVNRVVDELTIVGGLRRRADSLMPEFAEISSRHWYVHGGGRTARDDANLMRAAALIIERRVL